MRNSAIFSLLLVAVSAPAAPPAGVPDHLSVRAVAWDYSWKPATEAEWSARVVSVVAAAVKAGADVVVFPEGFSQGRSLEAVLPSVKDAAGRDRLVVLGNAPHRVGEDAVSRAYILSGEAWQTMDKLDPTPAERARTPPVKPGMRLPLFRFRGGTVAVLPAYSIEKTEIAASLKKRAISLVLVAAPPVDAEGAARLARCAAARAVELGAAVVIAPPSSEAPALHLPVQKGLELKPQAPEGRDFRIPWKKVLDLRVRPETSTEPRPFLEPAPYYQVEI